MPRSCYKCVISGDRDCVNELFTIDRNVLFVHTDRAIRRRDERVRQVIIAAVSAYLADAVRATFLHFVLFGGRLRVGVSALGEK